MDPRARLEQVMADADDSIEEGYVAPEDAEPFEDAEDDLSDVPDGDVVIIDTEDD